MSNPLSHDPGSGRVAVIPSLTISRFFAALAVVFLHTSANYHEQYPKFVENIAGSGSIGVSFFFVLSGFILYYNYATPDRRMRGTKEAFWMARAVRIYPLYLLSLLVTLPTFTVSLVSVETARELLEKVGTLVLTPILLQTWTPWTNAQWNAPTWTLSVEAFFYVVFPFALPIFASITRRTLPAVMAIMYALILLPPAVYMATGMRGDAFDAWSFDASNGGTGWWLAGAHPISRLPEFLLGITLGILVRSQIGAGVSIKKWRLIAISSTIGILLGMSLSSWLPHPMVTHGLFAPMFSILIVALAYSRLATRPQPVTSAFVLLGESSYALYLLHIPGWVATLKVANLVMPDLANSPVLILLYLPPMLVVSIVVFVYVENPARRYAKNRLAARRVPTEAQRRPQEASG